MIYGILNWLSSFVVSVIETTGYFGIAFFMALESAAIPIPSEIIMPFAGYLAATGEFKLLWVVFAGSLGNLVGSIILYGVGFYGGRAILERYGNWVLISQHDIKIADRLFTKYGQIIIFVSRMLPAVRTYISFPAGVARMDFKKFCLYTFAGSVPWAFVLAQVGVVMGENWEQIEPYFRRFNIAIAFVLVIVAVWWIKRHVRLRKLEV